ncbi:hypothetical protein A3C67_02010 [Candidatus Nomurabacteria bacterium RIFCSPHIGHO2_02_FULL_42_19]|uniref:Uncharacterized protein n=1 Tax=Candidatus Nomurabacteria bacterium RIFCSPHIGHO2_02_FULL_42_19 TaxID=1801756 RepID=A0A1F6W2P4_9BACT|nr:MAG: hypothetical protein A3C67_02010 [Candidatus Nomurabacteria bacterium RIFCSPHIGHO2_02_FULL_42_19]
MNNQIKIFTSNNWPLDPAWGKPDYELLDTGEGENLERLGKYTFVRPYEDAVWPKCSTPSVEQSNNRLVPLANTAVWSV